MPFLDNVILPQNNRVAFPKAGGGNFLDNVVLPQDQEEANKISSLQGQFQVAKANADYASSFGGLIKNTFADIGNKALDLGKTGYEALLTPLKATGEAGVETGTALREGKPIEAIASGIKLGTNIISSAFAPISAANAIAEKIPILKQAADILNLPFVVTGKIGEFAADKFTDLLPVSKETKDILRPALKEAGSLIGQIWLGGKVIETIGKKGEIGKLDIDTLKEQTKTVSPENPSPPLPPLPTTNAIKGGFLDNVILPEKSLEVSNIPEKEVKPIPSEFEPLVQEARKYKSAEEFRQAITLPLVGKPSELFELFRKPESRKALEKAGFIEKDINSPNFEGIKTIDFYNLATKEFKISPKVNLPEIEPITIRPETKIGELKTQIDSMEQALNENPAKQLSKYANKNGELPEVLGGVRGGVGATSKFGIRGDDIASELGFQDSEQAREAYQQYRKSRENLQKLKDELKTVKGKSFTDYTPEQIDKINTLLNQTAEGINPLIPVPSTGKILPSRLALKIEENVIEKKITKSLGDLPEYNRVNLKEQAQLAAKLIAENQEQAMRIAMGEELPPPHILPEAIFVGVENQAIKTGDIATLKRLATESNFSTQATAMGQRIRALGEREQESPVGIIRDIKKARETRVDRKGGLEKTQKETIDEIKTEIKKSISKRPTWEEFIKSIQCNY